MKILLFLLFTLTASVLSPSAGAAEDGIPEVKEHVAKVESRSNTESPWDIFEELYKGNQRYVQGQGHCQADYSGRRAQLLEGQKPKAIVLSCSDSRVPPELVFGQGLGDLFVIRTAGEVADRASIASIEYAVEHLGTKVLLVLGHEACGAVKAAITVPEGESAGSADLDYLLKQIRPDLNGGLGGSDKLLKEPVKVHAQRVAKRLVEQSAIVRKAVEEGRLMIVAAVYQLGSGKVDFIF